MEQEKEEETIHLSMTATTTLLNHRSSVRGKTKESRTATGRVQHSASTELCFFVPTSRLATTKTNQGSTIAAREFLPKYSPREGFATIRGMSTVLYFITFGLSASKYLLTISNGRWRQRHFNRAIQTKLIDAVFAEHPRKKAEPALVLR
jgi:hypothetical protein